MSKTDKHTLSLTSEDLMRLSGGLIMQKKTLKEQWNQTKESDEITGQKLQNVKQAINNELRGINETLEKLQRPLSQSQINQVKNTVEQALEEGGKQIG